MTVCENCGKKLGFFDNYERNGKKLCYDCAMKASDEQLKKGGNAFTLDHKVSENISVKSTPMKTQNSSKKPSDSWASRMKMIGKIVMVTIAVMGAGIGAVIGFNAEPIVGDDLPDMFLCGAIGLLIGGLVGILSMGLIMLLSEMGENTKLIASSRNTEKVNDTTHSDADELKKYKELLDLGVLTVEEFNSKKAEILNIKK